MAFLRILLIVLVSVLGLGNCAYVDTLNKCHLKDKECLKNLFTNILSDISKTGISELNIPPVDPVHFKNLKVSILNVFDMILIEGTAKGVRNCTVEKFDADFDSLHVYVELTCDLVIKAKYDMKSSSPLLKNLFGGDIRGNGNGKIKLEKLNIKMDFPYEIEKRGDDTFLQSDLHKYKYSCDFRGKVTFAADNLYLGDKESSKEIIKVMNDNWKTILDSFGNNFLDVAMNIVHDFLQKFFSNVPTKHYIVEDLTPYVL